MLKRLIKDSAVYGIASILARGISVLLIPMYTRVLTPAEFGVSDILTTVISLTSIVFTLEISQGVMRFFPDSREIDKQSAYASSSFWFVLTTHLILILLFFPFRTELSILFFQKSVYGGLFGIALVLLLFYSLYVLISIILRAKLLPIHFSIVNFTFILTSTLATIYFVLFLHLSIAGILLGNATGYGLAVVLGIIFARKNFIPHVDFGRLRELIAFSAPLVPSSFGYFTILYVNRFIINRALSVDEVGLYGVAFRLMFPVNLIMNSITNSLNPLIYNQYMAEETPRELASIFRLLTAVCLVMILGLSLFSSAILHVMTTPEYYAAANIIPLMAISAVLSGMNLFSPGLFIAQKTRVVSLINVSAGGLNIVLSYLLVYKMGLVGSALATALSLLTSLGISMYLSQKYYYIPIEWSRVIMGVLITIPFGLLPIFLTGDNIYTILEKITALAICASLLVMVGLIQPSEVLLMVNRLGSIVKKR